MAAESRIEEGHLSGLDWEWASFRTFGMDLERMIYEKGVRLSVSNEARYRVVCRVSCVVAGIC